MPRGASPRQRGENVGVAHQLSVADTVRSRMGSESPRSAAGIGVGFNFRDLRAYFRRFDWTRYHFYLSAAASRLTSGTVPEADRSSDTSTQAAQL